MSRAARRRKVVENARSPRPQSSTTSSRGRGAGEGRDDIGRETYRSRGRGEQVLASVFVLVRVRESPANWKLEIGNCSEARRPQDAHGQFPISIFQFSISNEPMPRDGTRTTHEETAPAAFRTSLAIASLLSHPERRRLDGSMNWLDRAEARFGHLAIHGPGLHPRGLQSAGLRPLQDLPAHCSSFCASSRRSSCAGQVWRLFTFIFIPGFGSIFGEFAGLLLLPALSAVRRDRAGAGDRRFQAERLLRHRHGRRSWFPPCSSAARTSPRIC